MSEDLSQDARSVAEMDADISVESVAAVYAEAFLGAAEAAGSAASLIEELDSLIADILAPHAKLEEILGSALISPEEKTGILDRVLGAQASPTMLSFLKVLASRGRLDCLRAIQRQVREQYDKKAGRVRIRVTTATEIDNSVAADIARSLEGLLDGEPVVEQTVDPEVLGGIVVRVGDTVYDASLATQLNNVRKEMISRSAHEIQSRRDRFSNPAGN